MLPNEQRGLKNTLFLEDLTKLRNLFITFLFGQSSGVLMIAIGVGNDVDYRELSYIAGKHVIMLTSFDEVLTKAHRIINELTRKACG